MIRPLPLLLILVVMLTSIGLGIARGTVRSGQQIVLCTGHGIVVTRLPGDEGTRGQLCPDMALSLLAAISPADVVLPDFGVHPRDMRPSFVARHRSAMPGQVRVRGPPGVAYA